MQNLVEPICHIFDGGISGMSDSKIQLSSHSVVENACLKKLFTW